MRGTGKQIDLASRLKEGVKYEMIKKIIHLAIVSIDKKFFVCATIFYENDH
jgi:hypothetical protein